MIVSGESQEFSAPLIRNLRLFWLSSKSALIAARTVCDLDPEAMPQAEDEIVFSSEKEPD